jgi:phosphoglycolate phosphatase-like HAD superfamily hydrolase
MFALRKIFFVVTLCIVSTFSYQASSLAVKQGLKTKGPVQAVFWDVDGTLVFTGTVCYEATVKTLVDNGLPGVSEEEYHAGNKYSTPQRFAHHATKNPEDPIGAVLGEQFDDLLVKTVNSEITPLFGGIKDIIDKLTEKKKDGLKLGALSNAGGKYVNAVLKGNGVDAEFDFRLGADDVPTPKPSPDGLLHCCKLVGVDPEGCIYIGDSPSDGKAAKAAGMIGIGVCWGSNTKEKLEPAFDYITESVPELDTLIESLMAA